MSHNHNCDPLAYYLSLEVRERFHRTVEAQGSSAIATSTKLSTSQ
ncbi:hypothetical protein [Atlanticothrix silvestris]|nr:hypothetical protein [Atlanticothrix silvestris]